jgi:hypothetical protein
LPNLLTKRIKLRSRLVCLVEMSTDMNTGTSRTTHREFTLEKKKKLKFKAHKLKRLSAKILQMVLKISTLILKLRNQRGLSTHGFTMTKRLKSIL